MNERELKRIVEALLFASEGPLAIDEIRAVLDGASRADVARAAAALVEEYASDDRALQLVEVAGGFQFTSKPRYHRHIRRLFRKKRESRLSAAALETLAVIAYRQPVARAEIERIRGVNVDGVLQTLMGRNLIRIAGREKGVGRALLYGTTRDFLLHFGLKDLAELPSYEEVERLFRPREEAGSPVEREAGDTAPPPAFGEPQEAGGDRPGAGSAA
jgi:segregation and condensation protein B